MLAINMLPRSGEGAADTCNVGFGKPTRCVGVPNRTDKGWPYLPNFACGRDKVPDD